MDLILPPLEQRRRLVRTLKEQADQVRARSKRTKKRILTKVPTEPQIAELWSALMERRKLMERLSAPPPFTMGNVERDQGWTSLFFNAEYRLKCNGSNAEENVQVALKLALDDPTLTCTCSKTSHRICSLKLGALQEFITFLSHGDSKDLAGLDAALKRPHWHSPVGLRDWKAMQVSGCEAAASAEFPFL